MGTSSKGTHKSRYAAHVVKFRYRILCVYCQRMRRRFVEAGRVKGQSILLCVWCGEGMRKKKVSL